MLFVMSLTMFEEIIVFAHPTSVLTQGVLHNIASAKTFGNDSLNEGNTKRSIPFIKSFMFEE